MTILVTGGAGYVGSHTVEVLLDNNYEVVVFDNLSQGHKQSVPKEAILVTGDLGKPADLAKVFADHKFDAVMHFAANSLVGESVVNPLKYIGDNVTNAINLFKAMQTSGVTKFILSSTANLFDKPAHVPITEGEAIIPGSPYGESKSIIERQLYWLGKTVGFRYAALRYFNATGASLTRHNGEDHSPETHLIPLAIQALLGKRDKLKVFGNDYPTKDGTCVRDYVHVTDLAHAHLLALKQLDTGSVSYNLGSGSGYTVLEVINELSRISGKEVPYEIAPRREGDPAILIADSGKIKAELGWKPNFGLTDIISSALAWHTQYPNGFES